MEFFSLEKNKSVQIEKKFTASNNIILSKP